LRSSLSDKKFKLVFASWWIAWAVIHYSVLVNYGLTNMQALTDSFVSNVLLAASCLLISNNMRYYLPRKEKYWYVLIISLALSCVWLFVTRVLLHLIYKNDTAYAALLSHSSAIRYGVAFLMVGCMATMSLLWYTQQEQNVSAERKAAAEKFSKEAELFKLRQQLQPHFLFNSLNSISALTGMQPEKARHMIQQLSDFLRGTLRKENDQWSSLKEEIAYLELYLDIEKVRFGYRLETKILYDEEILTMKLPSLLLQPVVENAIKFGLYDTIGEVLITIEAKANDDVLEINIKNPFDAETAQPLKGTGFGLSSIQRRLFLLFARKDLLQTKMEGGYFITTIIIPQLQMNN
jgi:two-component system, LytTR family, sensor kinase